MMCWICTVSPKRHTNWLCRGLFFPLLCRCQHTFLAKFTGITLCRRHVANILCLGGGWVGAGVMVGVVAAIWQRGRVEGAAPGKKREKHYHNTV